MAAKSKSSAFLFIFTILAVQQSLVECLFSDELYYCNDRNLCEKDYSHITCNVTDWGINRKCRSFAKLYDLYPIDKHFLMNEYLKWSEKKIAIEWDEELSQLAELNVNTCDVQFDECHNTPKYTDSGQHLFILWFPLRPPRNIKEILLKKAVNEWFGNFEVVAFPTFFQKENYTIFDEKKIVPDAPLITELANDIEVAGLGCAALEQSQPNNITVVLTCNYGNKILFPGEKLDLKKPNRFAPMCEKFDNGAGSMSKPTSILSLIGFIHVILLIIYKI